MLRQIFIMTNKMTLIFCALIFYIYPLYAAQCDPFTISCRNTHETLTKYPLSALSMLGTIQKQTQTWAIIKAPDQHIYPVFIGSSIGLGGGKATHISARQVVVAQGKNNIIILSK